MLVRNGDAHLKNFGVLYDEAERRLSPLFDVVTTTVYPYEREGVTVTDRTMALRLLSGGGRGYPLPDELLEFGRAHCHVREPRAAIERLAEGMRQTLAAATRDERVPKRLLRALRGEWEASLHVFAPLPRR